MAGTTRLELATSAVTGQRSNQLNYVPGRVKRKMVGGAAFELASFPGMGWKATERNRSNDRIIVSPGSELGLERTTPCPAEKWVDSHTSCTLLFPEVRARPVPDCADVEV